MNFPFGFKNLFVANLPRQPALFFHKNQLIIFRSHLDFVARLEGLFPAETGENDRRLVGEIQHERIVFTDFDSEDRGVPKAVVPHTLGTAIVVHTKPQPTISDPQVPGR